jgi:phage terminase large subunit-like protein
MLMFGLRLGDDPRAVVTTTHKALYRQHKADRIVAEVNNGGDMVEATIRMVDPNVSYSAVRATRGKVVRAEPVATARR